MLIYERAPSAFFFWCAQIWSWKVLYVAYHKAWVWPFQVHSNLTKHSGSWCLLATTFCTFHRQGESFNMWPAHPSLVSSGRVSLFFNISIHPSTYRCKKYHCQWSQHYDGVMDDIILFLHLNKMIYTPNKALFSYIIVQYSEYIFVFPVQEPFLLVKKKLKKNPSCKQLHDIHVYMYIYVCIYMKIESAWILPSIWLELFLTTAFYSETI